MRSALAALALIAGMVLPADAADPVTLFVNPQGPLLSLDPVAQPDYATIEHGYMVYDTLFALDDQLTAQPQMVESHLVGADGLEHAIALRPGLRWHDGAEVTAEDCIASLRRWMQVDPFGRELLTRIKAIEPTGRTSFTITLSRPFPSLAEALARPLGTVPFMMPARIAAAPPDQPIREAIGSGPFRLVQRSDGLYRTVYEKFADYLPRSEPAKLLAGGKRVLLDRVEWLYNPDAATATFNLNAGRVDYWDMMPALAPEHVIHNPDVVVRARDPFGQLGLLRLNHRAKPFDDARIRRAAALAVDRGALVGAVARLVSESWACPSVFACGLPGTEGPKPDATPQPDRREAARRQLREAGYDGKPVVLLSPSDQPEIEAIVAALAAQLRLVGFVVRIESMLWPDLSRRRASRADPEAGGWHGFVTRWPAIDLWSPGWNAALRSNGDAAWFGWPDEPRIEQLRQDWIDASSPERRKALRADLERTAAEQVPYVPLIQYRLPRGYRTYIGEAPAAPVSIFWGVTKKQ